VPRWLRVVQWLLERVTIRLGGEHLRRRPLLQVQAEGFQIERRKRSKLGIVEQLAADKPTEPAPPARPDTTQLKRSVCYEAAIRAGRSGHENTDFADYG
jgi:hypothetical protein